MAKQAFVDWKPNSRSRARLAQVNVVLEEFQRDGITLTLRQLYYQLVAKGLIPNSQREYSQLSVLLSKARMSGSVDWDCIEDRVRRPVVWASHDTIQDCAREAARRFALPRWDGQPEYVELWCEKDALSSVLRPICAELFATFAVNRGYGSTSSMYDARNRILSKAAGRPVTVVYLGDFDPSGENMVRDIRERLEVLCVDAEVVKLALNPDQVRRWRLPPNPAKISDSRAAGFVARHGKQSYEVDAIPPRDLQAMVRAAIQGRMDMPAYRATLEREERLRARLLAAVKKIR